jgi:hypothetical protein
LLKNSFYPNTTQICLYAHTDTMPLVVPGITSNGSGDKNEEWMNKLVGKKISETEPSNETVRVPDLDDRPERDSNAWCQTFCKTDLPKTTRVIEPGSIVTKDYNPDRLNVHLNDDGTVAHVNHG